MELIETLGLDSTIALQFGIFIIVYLFLSQVLFKPYMAAFDERQEQTIGKTDTAERFIAEAQNLEQEYATKAQEINRKFKLIYDESRSQAMKEHDRLVNEAREKAKVLTEQSRKKISEQAVAAQADLAKQIPELSKTIAVQVLGGTLQ
jgi:F0F1-type ATP synthase membrane subunit b/b'